MFRQSFIQVLKGLAEFHGYVPPAPGCPAESGPQPDCCQLKPEVVLPVKTPAPLSCCPSCS
jgi:hypothetical protein